MALFQNSVLNEHLNLQNKEINETEKIEKYLEEKEVRPFFEM